MSLLTPQRPSQGAHTDSAATMVPDQSRAERTASFEVADFPVPRHREPAWLAEERRAALRSYLAQPFPTERDERWRYTDTRSPEATPMPIPRVKDPAEAAAAIDVATTRDEVVSAVLTLGRCYFKRVVFFIVREPWIIGWDGAGEGMDRTRAAALRIPLDLPSVFQGVTRDRTVFVGRLGAEETNRQFLEAIGKKAGTTAAVLPVALRGRVVNLIWGDSGARGAARGGLGQLLAHMQKIPRAYLRIIRARVAEAKKEAEVQAGLRKREGEKKEA